jgi:hypothetical protein
VRDMLSTALARRSQTDARENAGSIQKFVRCFHTLSISRRAILRA